MYLTDNLMKKLIVAGCVVAALLGGYACTKSADLSPDDTSAAARTSSVQSGSATGPHSGTDTPPHSGTGGHGGPHVGPPHSGTATPPHSGTGTPPHSGTDTPPHSGTGGPGGPPRGPKHG